MNYLQKAALVAVTIIGSQVSAGPFGAHSASMMKFDPGQASIEIDSVQTVIPFGIPSGKFSKLDKNVKKIIYHAQKIQHKLDAKDGKRKAKKLKKALRKAKRHARIMLGTNGAGLPPVTKRKLIGGKGGLPPEFKAPVMAPMPVMQAIPDFNISTAIPALGANGAGLPPVKKRKLIGGKGGLPPVVKAPVMAPIPAVQDIPDLDITPAVKNDIVLGSAPLDLKPAAPAPVFSSDLAPAAITPNFAG